MGELWLTRCLVVERAARWAKDSKAVGVMALAKQLAAHKKIGKGEEGNKASRN